MATVIKTAECPACRSAAGEWREAKAGAASFYCPQCKFGGFAKSPMSAAAVRSSETPAAAPAAEKKKGGWLDEL